jgi:hypothetical protein
MIEIGEYTLLAAITAVTMCWVTWQAHRIGNERRDVLLLAAMSVLCVAGTGLTLVL